MSGCAGWRRIATRVSGAPKVVTALPKLTADPMPFPFAHDLAS